MPLTLELLRELARERRLSRTLQACEHDDRRGGLGEPQPALLAAEDLHELLVDDLHDLLRGVQRLVDLVTECPLAHLRREVLHDDKSDVGIEQSATDLADGAVDVGGGELSLRAQIAEGLGEPIGEGAKGSHGATEFTRAEPPRSAPHEVAPAPAGTALDD